MSEISQYTAKYQQLLRDLKNTVEGLLVSQVPNVWYIYGGLNRLHNSVEKIFKHGCKNSKEKEESEYSVFVQGLEWLQPDNSKSYFSVDCEYKPHVPQHMKNDKASIWLYRSLENHSLSQKLSWLLSDNTHVTACYQNYAFLCQRNYSEAALICLRAVERNQPSLLSEINPYLFLSKTHDFPKAHRRCSSFPDTHFKHIPEQNISTSKTIHFDNKLIQLEKNVKIKRVHGKLKPWHSMPSLQIREHAKIIVQCKTTPSTPVHIRKETKLLPSILKVDYSSTTKRKFLPKKGILKKTTEVRHVIINNYNIVEHTPPLSSSQSSGTYVHDELSHLSMKSLPEYKSPIHKPCSPKSIPDYGFIARPGEKDYKKKPKKTFIEDGGLSVLPMATGYFPRPTQGQSLTSFLTSSQFARTNAELDRENAHFSISEAMIAAVEQIRCRKDLKLADEQNEESDPEIIDLKQRIRWRRRQKLEEKQRKMFSTSLSDARTDTTTEASASPYSTTPESLSDSVSSDDVDDLEIDEASNLTDSRGISMSMASLYSEADLLKRPRGAPDGASDILSAEGVALSLISRFNEKQLPRASDLEWLVSEEDAPQALLPLPKSWPVSPDDSEEIATTSLRGTKEWAPPRPQIIFTPHPPPSRKKLLAKQNYRCAGCGMRVAPQYASRFRYCDYVGRYFCTGCHTNQVALIPGRILQKWDFTSYPVSTFSYRLLEQMNTDPLFRVFELNKSIGKRSKNLVFCHKYRLGLYYLKDFILTCRFAENIQECLEKEMPYLISDPDVYSIQDLLDIKNGDMKIKLKFLVELCCRHTSECELCKARGFICEICHNEEVIFPWQMKTVTRCSKCAACFHSACWNPQEKPCDKCIRIGKRRESNVSTSITKL